MARTITLRLSDAAYETVKRYAESDQQSMNSWLEHILDAEDMRRRCAAHEAWMKNNPHLVEETLDVHASREQDMEDAGLAGRLDGAA